jgi:hypothetical protein
MATVWSLEEARRLLRRWLKDSSPLYVVFSDPNLSLMSSGLLSSVSQDVLTLTLKGGEISMQFGHARFAYSEPNEAPSRIRESSMEKFISSLEIRLSDAVCLLYDLWADHEFIADSNAI